MLCNNCVRRARSSLDVIFCDTETLSSVSYTHLSKATSSAWHGPAMTAIFSSGTPYTLSLIHIYTENGADAKVLYGPEAWGKLSDAEKEKGLPIQAGDVKRCV